jgi:hypothetical protein
MKKLLKCVAVVGLMGCASDPGYEPRTAPEVIVSESPRRAVEAPEAPGKTIAELQACADRYALRSSADSVAILYDIEANPFSVKIKDSMISGSALEACLTRALEDMELTPNILNARRVSPQSRSHVGIVQAAAAPIALAPIALVAAGVTILVGVTIYVATEALNERERCKKVLQMCIDKCTEETLPTGTLNGDPFFQCRRRCLEAENCW